MEPTQNRNTSLMPKLPRGIGLAKRFLWVVIAGLVSLLILFLYFLHHYAPKVETHVAASESIMHTEAAQLIQAMQAEKPEKSKNEKPSNLPLPLASHQTPEMTSTPTPSSPVMDKAFLEAAGQSPISVYENSNGSPPLANSTSSHTEPPAWMAHSAELTLPSTTSGNDYQVQNQQNEKEQFLQSAGQNPNTVIASHSELPHSPYELKAGTLIPATLQTGMSSDLPGTIIAKVRQPVFDTATGNYLLIPQGTTLMGVYDAQVAYGQQRVLMAWQRLIFPNGMSQNLEGQPGVDLMGLAGLHDRVDNHYLRLFGSAMLFSIFGATAQLSQPPSNNTQLFTPQQIIAGAMGQQLSQTGAELVARNMNIQPTLDIRPGANFNVLLARDLVLSGPYVHRVVP